MCMEILVILEISQIQEYWQRKPNGIITYNNNDKIKIKKYKDKHLKDSFDNIFMDYFANFNPLLITCIWIYICFYNNCYIIFTIKFHPSCTCFKSF